MGGEAVSRKLVEEVSVCVCVWGGRADSDMEQGTIMAVGMSGPWVHETMDPGIHIPNYTHQ